jgi:hypothetical protein
MVFVVFILGRNKKQLSKQLYREFARSNNIKLNGYLFINNRANKNSKIEIGIF